MRLSLALAAGAVLMSSPIYTASAQRYNPECYAACASEAQAKGQHCRDFYGRSPDAEWCQLDADRDYDTCISGCGYYEEQGAALNKAIQDRYKPKELVAERALG